MKKASLVLLLWLSACCLVFGQVNSAKRTLFNEANGTISASVVFMSVSTALGGNTGGATWTAVDVSGIFGTRVYWSDIKAITYGGGKFAAVGTDGKIAYSTGK